MLLLPADFALQEQPEGNLMVALSRVYCIMANVAWPLSQRILWNIII